MNKARTHTRARAHTHAHRHTVTDSYEHITWYKIICYFETIDLRVTQWNKSLSEASPLQSILTCSPIHCILMIWSIYLLRCWLHRNTLPLAREEYKKKKRQMTRILLWDDIVLYVWLPRRRLWRHTAPLNIIHHLNISKKDEYIILFLGRYFYSVGSHYMPPLSRNKNRPVDM